ncbi:flagellar basal-body rod protein FlgB [Alicyclobacillus cellulosilyticus]|uniref:Flagellar basal body rod protein FlgB n=1 Tax=Alicyclobacillus cellulosilyticus TaxID=1003997 RepID=A0A917NEB6_9BACL|nr:flagellar basal body rod protein FlgB [Alicyclobacillus cellulosilyticus]GGI94817.1 flagellar basal-body rod protein FlgB [Alicyclobacillus cellulosilyticus]
MSLTSDVMALLQTALTAADMRQVAYANNIANADTPGYQRMDVSFEDALQQALGLTRSASPGDPLAALTGADWQAVRQIQPTWVVAGGTLVDNNGNNVDLDAEMAQLATNQIRYNGLVQALRSDFDRLHAVIGGASGG